MTAIQKDTETLTHEEGAIVEMCVDAASGYLTTIVKSD